MGKIEITKKVLGICATNCYTMGDTDTREAVIIDPGDRADILIKDWKDRNNGRMAKKNKRNKQK